MIYFSSFGEVTKVTIPYGKKENDFKGYAQVILTFSKKNQVLFKQCENVTNCLKSKHIINDRQVNCKKALNKIQAQKETKKKSQKKLFIGGLASETTEADLEKYFKQFGTIENIYQIYDKETFISRGFGFIEFDNVEDAKKAQEKQAHIIKNKKVFTKFQILKSEQGSSTNQKSDDNTFKTGTTSQDECSGDECVKNANESEPKNGYAMKPSSSKKLLKDKENPNNSKNKYASKSQSGLKTPEDLNTERNADENVFSNLSPNGNVLAKQTDDVLPYQNGQADPKSYYTYDYNNDDGYYDNYYDCYNNQGYGYENHQGYEVYQQPMTDPYYDQQKSENYQESSHYNYQNRSPNSNYYDACYPKKDQNNQEYYDAHSSQYYQQPSQKKSQNLIEQPALQQYLPQDYSNQRQKMSQSYPQNYQVSNDRYHHQGFSPNQGYSHPIKYNQQCGQGYHQNAYQYQQGHQYQQSYINGGLQQIAGQGLYIQNPSGNNCTGMKYQQMSHASNY